MPPANSSCREAKYGKANRPFPHGRGRDVPFRSTHRRCQRAETLATDRPLRFLIWSNRGSDRIASNAGGVGKKSMSCGSRA